MRLSIVFLALLTLCLASAPAMADSGSDPAAPAKTEYYQEFPDVLVPVELKYDDEESFVFETPSIRTGWLKFSGKVEALSLFNFFDVTMVREGWKKITSFKGKESILIFEKPGKSARVRVADEKFSTKVDILVVETR